MEAFFSHDALSLGAKGLVFIGDEVVIYRRDHNPGIEHPGELDVPGGGPEGNETPFETFVREVYEEFGLRIARKDIVWARRYASRLQPGKFGWYAVAKLPATAKQDIVFGNEGTEWMLMSPADYLARTDAWPVFQKRSRDYLNT